MLKKIFKIIGITVASILLVVINLSVVFYLAAQPNHNPTWGVNYSATEAEALGFEPVGLLRRVLSDLDPHHIRLTTYWKEIEPTKGQFNFSRVDALLDVVESTETDVILVIGHKQPRWPECHHPDWFMQETLESQEQMIDKMITETVNHFKNRKSIIAYQLENEPFFDFGEDCPVLSLKEYREREDLVRKLDPNRPLIVTDSGEKGPWLIAAWSGADILGSTMYREVYQNNQERYIKYPLPAFTYTIKTGMVKLLSPINQVIGVELQAEPWFNGGVNSIDLEAQSKLMNPEIFADNVEYARKAGFSQNYFWGTEWWYWLDKQGDPSMIEAAKQVFQP